MMIPVVLAEASSGLAPITQGATDGLTFMSTAFSQMTGNVYLAVFLGATLLTVGIRIFTKLRRGT